MNRNGHVVTVVFNTIQLLTIVVRVVANNFNKESFEIHFLELQIVFKQGSWGSFQLAKLTAGSNLKLFFFDPPSTSLVISSLASTTSQEIDKINKA